VTCITENIVSPKRLNCKEYFTNIRLDHDGCAKRRSGMIPEKWQAAFQKNHAPQKAKKPSDSI
jgi:hypothetical protein